MAGWQKKGKARKVEAEAGDGRQGSRGGGGERSHELHFKKYLEKMETLVGRGRFRLWVLQSRSRRKTTPRSGAEAVAQLANGDVIRSAVVHILAHSGTFFETPNGTQVSHF